MDRETSKVLHRPKEWRDFLFQRKVPILYYHRVEENIPPKFGVSPQIFKSQMEYLRRRNYSSISFDDLENYLLNGFPLTPRPFIVSFDDGYTDIYTQAFPILKKFGFVATVFLVSDYIGKRSEWDGCEEREAHPLMDRENIHRMKAEGFHFGSHSRTHKKLTAISIEAAMEEIKKSKEDLENLLQQSVRSFSYPYGDFDQKIAEMVNKAGYGAARAVHRGNLHFKEDINQLRCVKINGLTPKRKFAFYLSRTYHLEQIWKERRARKKERVHGTYLWQPEKQGLELDIKIISMNQDTHF